MKFPQKRLMIQKVIKEDINQVNNQYHEELLKNQEAENSSVEEEVSFTHEASFIRKNIL